MCDILTSLSLMIYFLFELDKSMNGSTMRRQNECIVTFGPNEEVLINTLRSSGYHPHIRISNVFQSYLSVCVCVCVCVCLSVCLSVCSSVQAVTFGLLHIETLYLVCRCILTMSRSCLSIKIIGSRSRSYEKMIILLISTC